MMPAPVAGRVENIVGSLFNLKVLETLNAQENAMKAGHTGLPFRA